MPINQLQNTAEGDVDKLVMERFFPASTAGVFVDIGAARPDYLSVSALFRAASWKVIAVEPNPDFCALHREAGYEVLQYACGDRDEDDVDFFVVDSHGTNYRSGKVSYESFSSLGIKEEYAALKPDLDRKLIKVSVRRLDSILSEHAPDVASIDVLSVDVEGWELEVLAGLSFHRFAPKVMVIENLLNEKRYRTYMADLGYVLWRYIPPNDVYVRKSLLKSWDRFLSRIRVAFATRLKG